MILTIGVNRVFNNRSLFQSHGWSNRNPIVLINPAFIRLGRGHFFLQFEKNKKDFALYIYNIHSIKR